MMVSVKSFHELNLLLALPPTTSYDDLQTKILCLETHPLIVIKDIKYVKIIEN